MVGHVGDRDDAARPRHRAAHQGRRQRARRDQPRARHRQVRQAGLRRVDDHRAGQRPGRPRARPQVRPAARQPRHHQPRAPGRTSRRCGAATSPRSPARASRRRRSSRRSTTATIKGLLSICFNPAVSAPDANFTARGARPARVLRRHRLLPVRVRRTTPTSCCPARCTRRTRARRPAARDGSSRSTPPSTPPGEARRDWEILLDIAERLGQGRVLPVHEHRGDLRRAVPGVSAGGTADYTRRHLATDRGRDGPVLADPRGRPPRHAPPVRGRPVLPPRRQGPLPRRCRSSESAEVVDDDYPVLADHRPGRVSQYLSGTQTRRIAALVAQYPEPLCEMHPRLAEQLGVADGDLVTVTSRRGDDHAAGPRRQRRSGPTPCSSPTTGPGAKAANQLTNRAVDPLSKMPEFKVAAVRVERAGGRPTPPTPATSTCTRADVSTLRHRRRTRCSSSTRAAASAARRACRRARNAAPTAGQSLIHLERVDRAHDARRPRRWCACTARTRRAPRCARPTRSSRPRTASCSRRSSRAASAARTACSPARSACPKYVAEFDQMMKCDMCTDRTVRRAHADVRVGVPERGALVRHDRASSTTPAAARCSATSCSAARRCAPRCYTVVDDLAGGPLDVLAGDATQLARRPVRPRREATP